MEKLSAGAARNLEPGETVCELVQTQTGQTAAANATAVMNSEFVSAQSGIPFRVKTKAGPHVLVATERNLYAMTLSGARLLNVGDVVMKLPLDQAQADLSYEKRQLILGGRRSTSWGCSASTPTASTPTCTAATASPSR